MSSKPLRCRVGFHDWVRRHPPDERIEGPDQQVCRSCGRRRGATASGVPPTVLG